MTTTIFERRTKQGYAPFTMRIPRHCLNTKSRLFEISPYESATDLGDGRGRRLDQPMETQASTIPGIDWSACERANTVTDEFENIAKGP